jgi:hypothetical protein
MYRTFKAGTNQNLIDTVRVFENHFQADRQTFCVASEV